MIRPVVNDMATLTQASQVLQPVIAGIVIEVGSGENDAGLAHESSFFDVGIAGRTSAMIAPSLTGLVVPPSIRQNANGFAMRAAAALTEAPSALKPHIIAELRPVDRIEPAHLSLDRHSTPRALVTCSPSRGSLTVDKLHSLQTSCASAGSSNHRTYRIRFVHRV